MGLHHLIWCSLFLWWNVEGGGRKNRCVEKMCLLRKKVRVLNKIESFSIFVYEKIISGSHSDVGLLADEK